MTTRVPIAALTFLLALGACGSRPDLTATDRDVRTFMRTVAEDVTKRGPAAWQNYFPDTPAFFMAVDGHVEFASGNAARAAIPQLISAIRQLELTWGTDLRVNPLTEDLAAIGAPWHELITLTNGTRTDTSGYLTAIAERRNGHWQFRNLHWSTSPASAPAK